MRKLLYREIETLGCRAVQARNGIELIEILDNEKIDLLILDPELSFLYETAVIKKMKSKSLSLPVIIHSFQNSDNPFNEIIESPVFIEKGSSSIEIIKQEIKKHIKSSGSSPN